MKAKGPGSTSAEAARAEELKRDPLLHAATLEHYADAELYDHEYRRRRADVNWYRDLARRLVGAGKGEVLELGCGSGRLLVPLVRDGQRVTGVDLSKPMLRRCEERVGRLPAAARARATLTQGDFRDLALGRRFPLVVTPFNAMMHLYNRADVERFLAVVKAHLAPGGTFAFDVMNPNLSWLTRDPHKRWARTRFKDPRTGKTWFYSTNHDYDAAAQLNWIRIYYDEEPVGARAAAEGPATGRSLPQRVRSRVIHLAQRQFFPEELLSLLHYNGFTVDKRDGGFAGEAFVSESDSQVCTCSIRGGARR